MRIGLDYLLASTHAPGLGRYARELVRALVRLDSPEAHALTLKLWEWGAMERSVPESALGLPANLARHSIRWPARFQPWAARLGFSVERRLGPIDLFHRVLPDRPRLKRTPYTLPVVEIPAESDPALAGLRAAAQAAAGVFVFCEAYRERLVRDWRLDPNRVFVVPVGCEHWWRDRPPVQPTRQNRVLVLGALRSARRALPILAGYGLYRSQGGTLELEWIGHLSPAEPEIAQALQASGPMAPIHHTHALEAEMPERVLRAHALLHLARDEGSPVTPLEADRMGLHLVLERLPAFEEVWGPNGAASGGAPVQWLAPEPPPAAIAAGLHAVEALPTRAVPEPSAALAARFTWEACARAHLAAWQSLLEMR